jgi:hypothetical protein
VNAPLQPTPAPTPTVPRAVCGEERQRRINAEAQIEQLERELSYEAQQRRRLQERLDERKAEGRWRRELLKQPTAQLSAMEKLILIDLYAVFRARSRDGKDIGKPLWIDGRAEKIGTCGKTYGNGLVNLHTDGAIERRGTKDPTTGNTRIIAVPTERFWNPEAIRRPVARDYGYHPHCCKEHPNAPIEVMRKTQRVQLEREDIEEVYVCTTCRKVTDRETTRRIIPDSESLRSENLERFLLEDDPNRQLVDWPPDSADRQDSFRTGLAAADRRMSAARDPQSAAVHGLAGGAPETWEVEQTTAGSAHPAEGRQDGPEALRHDLRGASGAASV